ncbi:MAG: formate dehydrogenase accessory protein FdhE [Acidobacteria bacterium]|nr:formate dehydrogenase accessory protein FdhE [Acidobacteriota bacterium]
MRAQRARALAVQRPDAAEVLELAARAYEILDPRPAPDWDQLPGVLDELYRELSPFAPGPLRNAKPEAEELGRYLHEPNPLMPASFYARLALEAWARGAPIQQTNPKPNECPHCGHAPQLGVLRPAGNGEALMLACSLCRREWPYRRISCPQCGESDHDKLTFYTTPKYEGVQVQTCSTCSAYIYLFQPEKEPALVPEVDELSLLALDVWALELGYQKVWPNLAGV